MKNLLPNVAEQLSENLKQVRAIAFRMPMDVCPVCYKFLQSIYDRKKMREVRLDENKPCMSSYHKKLTDSFKS